MDDVTLVREAEKLVTDTTMVTFAAMILPEIIRQKGIARTETDLDNQVDSAIRYAKNLVQKSNIAENLRRVAEDV